MGWLLISGCEEGMEPGTYQGYVEAEYVYVASPRGGELKELLVQRGQEVAPPQSLFVLDPEPEATVCRQAVDLLRQVDAQWEDLKKGLRPTELASIEARRDQAQVSLQLAELEFKRVSKLYDEQVVSVDDLDRARATRDLYQAQVTQLTADLETGRLGAREDALRAAEAAVAAAQAALAQAEWNLAQKTQGAPTHGVVHDTLYQPGEWVGPGNPVVVLLPPANLKVRFFVSQAELATMKPGSAVRVSFDGAPSPYQARISYVSTRAEFTPPVIYSRQTRAKLVFMVEARLEAGDLSGLRPGQPVEVTRLP